ncbi:MAG: hypothetical protein K2I45_01875 [Muribaculaceae bacterium]|nr:hypothetical protein [Muribaculaceae bacterium]
MDYNDIDKPLYSIEDEEKPLYEIADPRDDDSCVDDPEHLDEDDEDYDDDCEEDDDAAGRQDAAGERKQLSPFSLLLKTMFTPVEGWKALKRARIPTDQFASRCFYPLIALAAVSEISKVFYEANVSIADWAVDGLGTFITFFFGYFTVILAAGIILPPRARDLVKKDIGRQFVMLTMSTLAVFWILIQVMPMFEPVLVFLPLWTIYLIYKGIRVLRVPSEVENSTTGLMCMLIIGVPIFWNWLMAEVLLPAT